MKFAARFVAGLLIAVCAAGSAVAEPVALVAADKVRVFAEYYGDADKARPVVLLFHQASSNAGEYATIAPRLNALGFNALAVDQRSGGSGWGRDNQTARGFRGNAGFEQTLPDLEAAFDWARLEGRTGKIVLWGSSYSASLVFLLAAKHPGQIAGLIAFSPGEYLGGGSRVRSAAAKVTAPIFVSSASDAGEIAEARAIIEAAPAAVKSQYRPKIRRPVLVDAAQRPQSSRRGRELAGGRELSGETEISGPDPQLEAPARSSIADPAALPIAVSWAVSSRPSTSPSPA